MPEVPATSSAEPALYQTICVTTGARWSGSTTTCRPLSRLNRSFFGRCAFVWFYLTSAMDILQNWHTIAADLAGKHVPLPPLVLHTLYTRNAEALSRWLRIRPTNAVTVLDTHDGIGVEDVDRDSRHPDDEPLLPRAAIDALIDTIDTRSRGESREASGAAASNVDVSQINCTFYDALGRRDNEYLIARAIQCFVPGIPQLYYVGLLAGTNDMALLRRTRVGRDINRRYYTAGDVEAALARPVVRSLLALLRLRNTHPAFAGTFRIALPAPTYSFWARTGRGILSLLWKLWRQVFRS